MTRILRLALRCLWLGAACSWCACAHLGSAGGGVGIGEPEWVERGSALVVDGDARYFAGVGMACDRLRVALLKKIAERKAKAAVAEPLKAYLKAVAGPWLRGMDAKTAKEMRPTEMLDKLLERAIKPAPIEEVFVRGDESAVFALARLDLMALLMEMEASPELEPLRTFLTSKGFDAKAVFDQVAAGFGVAGQAGARQAGSEPGQAPPAGRDNGEASSEVNDNEG